MNEIVIKANAKINLSLDVLSKREDGYHELEMIMCEIPLFDIVKIKKADAISLKCDISYIPSDERNIAFKAAKAFFEYTGIRGGAKIYLEKNIPACAGLAGGSTDGAAVIKGLNILYDTKLPGQVLEKIGDTVGKDVPFCIRGGVCLAKGTGEKLTDLEKLKNCWIVLVKPDNINVSTKDVFTRFDSVKTELHPYTGGIISALCKNDITGMSRMMYNVLENVTSEMYPVINDIKNQFISDGAAGTVMSGSGPSVFAVFTEKEKALMAYGKFKKHYRQAFFLDMSV